MISQQRVRSCIEQALQRTELEGEADELMELGLRPPRKCGEFAVVRCASTHMLSLHPQKNREGRNEYGLSLAAGPAGSVSGGKS